MGAQAEIERIRAQLNTAGRLFEDIETRLRDPANCGLGSLNIDAADELAALKAKLARAKEALRDCASSLESELKERYAALEPDRYPHNATKFERDMEPVRCAAAVLAELESL